MTLNSRPLTATERKRSFFGLGFMMRACHGIVSSPPWSRLASLPQLNWNCATFDALPKTALIGAWDVSRRCTPEENFSAIWERLRRQYLPQFLFIPVTKRAPRETWEISSEALKISTDVPTPSQPYHVQLPGAPGVVDWCSKFLSFFKLYFGFYFPVRKLLAHTCNSCIACQNTETFGGH